MGGDRSVTGQEGGASARIAIRLVAATLVYNVVEAVVALASGRAAESIALFGFGLDSLIECAASAALLWRLSVESEGRDAEAIEEAERWVRRFVGGTFLALSAYLIVQAGRTLLLREAPSPSLPGILLASASLLIMPALAWLKLRAAGRLGSRALAAEAKETLACAILSLTLLVGLLANAAAGWWWADPIAALLMIPWLVKEGLEGFHGETCECHDA